MTTEQNATVSNNPKSHLSKLSFCGIRRLNLFKASTNDLLYEWTQSRRWYALKTINIVIGVNGGGKSTVLELVDLLRSPTRLISLPRENKKSNQLTAFEFVTSDNHSLLGMSHSNANDILPDASNLEPHTNNIQSIELVVSNGSHVLAEFSKNVSKSSLDTTSHAELRDTIRELNCDVHYWTGDNTVAIADLAAILNRAATHLPGVLSSNFVPKDDFERSTIGEHKTKAPFRVFDEQRVRVWLSDDITQQNHVHVSALPAGWRRLVSILDWMQNIPRGSICLIEEPETHLHPRLQRHLAKEMDKIVEERSLQLFISTHSTSFQQANLWQHETAIFEATAETLEEFSSARRILDALGIRGSDVSQSNGVIWVEGPSDRRYIKHWLKLYCAANAKTEPIENIDYSFCFYGGAVLSHMSVSDQDSFISMLSMNRNIVLVMDRDKDFAEDTNGNLVCIEKNSAKARVLNELEKLEKDSYQVWVTDKYTIESYLPAAILNKYFIEDAEKRLVLKRSTKVAISIEYVEEYSKFDECTILPEKLKAHIATLENLIARWNA